MDLRPQRRARHDRRASIGCFNQQESHPSSQSCSGATFYIKINGVVYPTISWTVQKNSCIPNIAV